MTDAIKRKLVEKRLDKDIIMDCNQAETFEFFSDIMLHHYGQDYDLQPADFEKWFNEGTQDSGGIMYLAPDGACLDLFEKCIRRRSQLSLPIQTFLPLKKI